MTRGAVLLGAFACQTDVVPPVQSEPRAEPAAERVTPAVAAHREPQAQVGLARYEEAAPAAHAKTSAGAAPAVVAHGASAAATTPVPAGEAPKTAAGSIVQGAVITEEPFSIWLQAVSPVSAGAPAKVEAVLVAKPPYHCNAEYPHKFKLGPAPAGLVYPEGTVKGMAVTAERSVLAIPVQAQSAGVATVSGTLQFSVCTEERCLVEKRDLSLALNVK